MSGHACIPGKLIEILNLNLPSRLRLRLREFHVHVRKGQFIARVMSCKGAPGDALFTSMCGGYLADLEGGGVHP